MPVFRYRGGFFYELVEVMIPVRTLSDRRSVVVHFAPYYTTHCGLTVLCALRYLDVFQRQRVNFILYIVTIALRILTRNILLPRN